MRDLAISIVLLLLVYPSLKRPVVGCLVYLMLSVLAPHRFAYTFAYDAPWAMLFALIATVSVYTRHANRLGTGMSIMALPLLFLAWSGVAMLTALDRYVSYPEFAELAKKMYGLLLLVVCLNSMKEVRQTVAVIAVSLGLFGLKGMLFMIRSGGVYRVEGPPQSILWDNNHLAVGMVVAIPLLLWLASTTGSKLKRLFLLACTVGCAFSTIGTYSRGGFLALGVVGLFVVIRAKNKIRTALLFAVLLAAPLTFMPEEYWDRISTITEARTDASAQGRFDAWQAALNIASSRPTGGGFNYYENKERARIYWDPEVDLRAAHSIYFQTLGDQGFPGLLLLLLIFGGTILRLWFSPRHAKSDPDADRKAGLRAALQSSLLAYCAGGAMLSLAYWEVPYFLCVLATIIFRPLPWWADQEVKTKRSMRPTVRAVDQPRSIPERPA